MMMNSIAWPKCKILACHVVADVLTVSYFAVLTISDVRFSSFFPTLLNVPLILLMRCVLTAAGYRELIRTGLKRWLMIDGKFYIISELFSTQLFLASGVLILKWFVGKDWLTGVMALGSYVILWLFRVLLYEQFGLEKRQLQAVAIAAFFLWFYISILNAIDIDILVWFLPLFVFEILDKFPLLRAGGKEDVVYQVTEKGKRVVLLLKIWLLLTIVLNQLLISDYRLRQFIWIIDDWFFRVGSSRDGLTEVGIPISAIVLGLMISILLFRVNDRYLLPKLTKSALVQKVDATKQDGD